MFPVAGNKEKNILINEKRKKNGVDTEMGYCPFEHKAGRAGRALGCWGARRVGPGQARRRRTARGAHSRGPATRQPGAATRPVGQP